MSTPVALITGACSGIGLALTLHLLSKGWQVVMADVQAPPADVSLPTDSTIYLNTDVSSWDQQAHTFARAFAWRNRLDAVALNAGIDERDDIFNSINPEIPPKKPNMTTFEIDLLGVYYGIKLFAHYASRNAKPGGKIVLTSSAAGLYGSAGMPQYASAKAGVISLARSLAIPAAQHGITINAVCPNMVATPLPPKAFLDSFPKDHITPMEIIMQAFDEFLDPEKGLNGEVSETAPTGVLRTEHTKPLGSLAELHAVTQKKFIEASRERNMTYATKE